MALQPDIFGYKLWRVSEKPMTVAEMARMGGIARAKAHSKAELRAWGRQGGHPVSLGSKALARLETLLHQGKSQGECAVELGVSIRTIGRAVSRIRAGG
jgi:DNA-binding NarL/FixJ family response regulator